MLQVNHLNVFYGSMQALHDISLDVNKGEFVAIIGSNGAGKTTLLRTISGLLRPVSGEVLFRNQPIHDKTTHEICEQGLIQVPEGRELFPRMTVRENLEIGAYSSTVRKNRTDSLHKVLDLLPLLNQRQKQDAGTLSGGEQQMLAIGRGLMAVPSLLMLDEPSLGLAPILVERILEILQQLNKEGITILLVSQEVRQSLELADRAYIMENGRIVRSDSASVLLADENILNAYLGM